MPIYTDGVVGPRESALQEFETTFGQSIKATTEEAWRGSYWKTWKTALERARLDEQGPSLSLEQATAKIKGAGVDLEATPGMSDAGLDLMIERKQAETRTADVLSRARSGVMGEQSVARFVTGLGVGVLDPVNLAAAFFPVGGVLAGMGLKAAGARVTAMGVAAREAPTLGGRLGAAAGFGAIEGVGGAIALEPFYAGARSYLQDDYGMVDSLVNVGLGGVFAGGLHVGIRGGVELRDAWVGRSGVARAPGSPGEPGASGPSDQPPAGGGGAGSGAPDLAPAEPRALQLEGAPTRVKVGDRYEPARFGVIEADDLAAGIEKSAAQYRDRGRAAYQQETRKRANELDFELVQGFAGMDHGAPVLARDGRTIIAGNGRTLSIQMAYEIGTAAERYRGPLIKRAAEFGLDPRAVAGMRRPVLVRRFDGDVDVERVAQLSNEAGATPMSELELAKVDAERLGELSAIEVNDAGSVRTAGNRALFRRWLEQQPENQRNALLDRDGYLSTAGLRRVQNAILFRAYGDTPTLARLLEASDAGARNVAAGLTRAAAAVAEAKAGMARGELHAVDLVPDLEAAVATYSDLRARGVTVSDWLANLELVDGLTPAQRTLVAWFDEHSRSPRAIAELVQAFYRGLERAGAPGQADMFGGVTAPSVDALLEAAVDEARLSMPAAELVANASPEARAAAARGAIAQLAEGRAVDVAAVIEADRTGQVGAIVDAGERSRRAEAVMVADEAASALTPEPKAPKGSQLEQAEAAASESRKLLQDIADAGAEGWRYSREAGKGRTMYHGSPGRFTPEEGFPLGTTRWRFINEGEGQQAYGYGHYLTSRESLARERYRDRLLARKKDNLSFSLWTDPLAADDLRALTPADFAPGGAGRAAFGQWSDLHQQLGSFLEAHPKEGPVNLAAAFGVLDEEYRINPARRPAAIAHAAGIRWRAQSAGVEASPVAQAALKLAAQALIDSPLSAANNIEAWKLPGGRIIGTSSSGARAWALKRAIGEALHSGATKAHKDLTAQLARDEANAKRAREALGRELDTFERFYGPGGELADQIPAGWRVRLAPHLRTSETPWISPRADEYANHKDMFDGGSSGAQEMMYRVLEVSRPDAKRWYRFGDSSAAVNDLYNAAPKDERGSSLLATRAIHAGNAIREVRAAAEQVRRTTETLSALDEISELSLSPRIDLTAEKRKEFGFTTYPAQWRAVWRRADPSGDDVAWVADVAAELALLRREAEGYGGVEKMSGAFQAAVKQAEQDSEFGGFALRDRSFGDQLGYRAVHVYETLEEALAAGDAHAAAEAPRRLREEFSTFSPYELATRTRLLTEPSEPALTPDEESAVMRFLDRKDKAKTRREVLASELPAGALGGRTKVRVEHPGSVYTMEIPEALNGRLAVWDDLLSEDAQPREVMAAVRALMPEEAIAALGHKGFVGNELAAWRILTDDDDGRMNALIDRAGDLIQGRIDRAVREAAGHEGGTGIAPPVVQAIPIRGGVAIVDVEGRANEYGLRSHRDALREHLWLPITQAGPEVDAAVARVQAELRQTWAELNAEVADLPDAAARKERVKLYKEDLEDRAYDQWGDWAQDKAHQDLLDEVGGDASFGAWYSWMARNAFQVAELTDLLDVEFQMAMREVERRRGLRQGTYGDDTPFNNEELLSVMLYQAGVPGHLFADGFTRHLPGPKTWNGVMYADEVATVVDRYSRGQAGVGPAAVQVAREIERLFGRDGAALLEFGQIRVLDSPKDLGGRHPPDARGATRSDGSVVLFAENIAPGEVRGLVLHEVGVHAGMERMLGADGFAAILEAVDKGMLRRDPAFLKAYEMVPWDTPQRWVREETIAYMVANQPGAPFVRKLLAQVRAWFIATFPQVASRMKITPDDLVALAQSALRREARARAAEAVVRPAPAGMLVADPVGLLSGRSPIEPHLRPDAIDDVERYSREPGSPRDIKDQLAKLDELVARTKKYRDALQAAAGVAEDRRAEVMRAAVPDLARDEVQLLLDELRHANIRVRGSLRSLRDQLGAEDAAAANQEAALAAANQAANNLHMAAVIRQRMEQLNMAARLRGVTLVMGQFDNGTGKARGYGVAEGFMALLGGTERRIAGGRASVFAEQQQFHGRWTSGLVHDLEKAGLWEAFHSDALALDVVRALQAFGTGADTRGINRDAIAIAKIVRKYQEDARVTRNRHGAWIRDLRGYAFRQAHDQDKVYGAGKAEWVRFTRERLDVERTFGQTLPPDVVDEHLGLLWQDFSSGNHHRYAEDDEVNVGPASLARRVSQSRELYFTTPEGSFEYMQTFGDGGFAAAIVAQLEAASRSAGLLKVLGTNPEANLTKMLDEVSDGLTTDPKAREAFDERRGRIMDLLTHVDGRANQPGSRMGAQVSSFVRGVETITKLGGAVLSSVTDVPVYGAAVRSAGGGIFDGMGKGIASLFEGRSSQERKDVLSALGVYFDSMTGGIIARFDAGEPASGMMSRALQLYFKLNLLTPWTERLRTSAALTFSHMLALSRERSWSDLNADLKARLEGFRFNEGRWNVVRLASTQEADGRLYLTPEGMRSVPDAALANHLVLTGREATPVAIANLREDLGDALRAYFVDMAHHAVVEPDVRTRHFMLRGTQPGTLAGELLRFFGQFKAFPVALTRMVLGREVYGKGYSSLTDMLKRGRGDVLGLVELMLLMTAFGYGAMTVKDLLKGRKPRPPDSLDTWQAAFAQGGGAGIYGDFLFGEMRNRYGGGLLDTLAGPAAGSAAQLADLWGRFKKGDDLGAAALRFGFNHTPGLNLFYLRFALDYLVLYRLQEAVNPGYLRRMEGRIRRENEQEFWLPPSEAIR